MNFPDCEIFDIPQHLEDGDANPEWLELRRGNLTASAVGAWLMKCTTATAQKARESAICKIIAETANAWSKPDYQDAIMKRGLEHEAAAVESFTKSTGHEVRSVGYCQSNFGHFGCSPDGLIGNFSGLEGKVGLPGTHIKFRRAKILPPEYHLQVQHSMAVTGATSWWFQSWNPGLAPLRIKVERTRETDEMLSALKAFSKEVDVALEEEKQAWFASERGAS